MFCEQKKRRFSTDFEVKILKASNPNRVFFDLTWIKKDGKFVAEIKTRKINDPRISSVKFEVTASTFGDLKNNIINLVKNF